MSDNNKWDAVFPKNTEEDKYDRAPFIAGSLITVNPSSSAFKILPPDPWELDATCKDIEIVHIRLDNPGMSREEATDLFEMHKEMGILNE